MVPQYSIESLTMWKIRAITAFYQPELNGNMNVKPEDVSADCECYYFWTRIMRMDRVHVEHLKPVLPHAHLLLYPIPIKRCHCRFSQFRTGA